MGRVKTFFSEFYRVFGQNEVLFNSSAVTFNLILCSIPFTLLITSIFGFVLQDDETVTQLSRLIHDFLPAYFTADENPDVDIEQTILQLLMPLIEKRGVYGILGFAILSFTSLGLFTAVKHVLFVTFEIKYQQGAISKMIYNFFAFGLVGGVFIFFTSVISLASIITIKTIRIPALDIVINIGILYELLGIFLPIIFNLSLFYVFFRYGSERKIDRGSCLFGAATYVFTFEAAKYLFGLYLSYFFMRVQNIYQGYSIILMLGFWAFYGAIAFIVSAIAARAFQLTQQPENATSENVVTPS
ncbi:hypothetical protein EP331_06050 [bacterium]|nr:MAG: hypothetical protein EP331_06050 [bacterium]